MENANHALTATAAPAARDCQANYEPGAARSYPSSAAFSSVLWLLFAVPLRRLAHTHTHTALALTQAEAVKLQQCPLP